MDILEDLRTTTFSNNEAFFKKAACEIEQLRTENAALKEQVAQWETEYNGCSTLLNNAERTIETLEETITQQAEAIRLKDAALDWCIGEFNLRLDDIDLSQETIRVLSARHIQPSPEILQARDEPVAYLDANYGFMRCGNAADHLPIGAKLYAVPPQPAPSVPKGWTAIHLKTGNEYQVIGEAIDATNMHCNQLMVIYQRDGKTFVREAEEFQEKFKASVSARSE